MVVNNDEIIQLLSSFGLSDYEARAYIGLLRSQPATAYEVARSAGIPTSKIYETINRLLDKNLAQPVSATKGRGQQYMALSAEDFIYLKQRETVRNTERLGPLLSALNNGTDSDFVWQLDSDEQVLDKTRQLIAQAQTALLVSLWPQELEKVAQDLRAAEKRGVQIALVHFGKTQLSIGATFHHPRRGDTARRKRRAQFDLGRRWRERRHRHLFRYGQHRRGLEPQPRLCAGRRRLRASRRLYNQTNGGDGYRNKALLWRRLRRPARRL